MEPECSLPHSQVPATCPYPEPARSSPHPLTSHFLKIHLTKSHVPFSLLRPYQSVSPGPRQVFMFRNNASFYDEELSKPRRTPQAGGPPLVGCPWLLIQYIRSYRPYWRPFLHPQREDAPCRGDKDPLNWSYIIYQLYVIKLSYKHFIRVVTVLTFGRD